MQIGTTITVDIGKAGGALVQNPTKLSQINVASADGLNKATFKDLPLGVVYFFENDQHAANGQNQNARQVDGNMARVAYGFAHAASLDAVLVNNYPLDCTATAQASAVCYEKPHANHVDKQSGGGKFFYIVRTGAVDDKHPDDATIQFG